MKHISQVLGKGVAKSAEQPELTLNAEAVQVVDDLFRILAEHTKYFRLNSSNQEEYNFRKREWVKTFALAGIGEKSVARGINRIRAQSGSFATMTPGEFLSFCCVAPEDISSPDIGTAYLEACKNSHPCETNKKWSHKAVQYATHKTGSHFLRTESRAISYPAFEKNYLEACQMYFEGKILDQIGNDSPQLRREIEETQKIIADGYEQFNCPDKALSEIKNLLR